jgi:hypothetical protein
VIRWPTKIPQRHRSVYFRLNTANSAQTTNFGRTNNARKGNATVFADHCEVKRLKSSVGMGGRPKRVPVHGGGARGPASAGLEPAPEARLRARLRKAVRDRSDCMHAGCPAAPAACRDDLLKYPPAAGRCGHADISRQGKRHAGGRAGSIRPREQALSGLDGRAALVGRCWFRGRLRMWFWWRLSSRQQLLAASVPERASPVPSWIDNGRRA